MSLFCNAQKIRFTYDASGNQILRTVCPGCSSKNSQTPPTSEKYRDWETDRKSTRLNSSHLKLSRMPSSA